MPTYALEGTGATIGFSTSNFTSDLISLNLPDVQRGEIETTHLGTIGAKTFKPTTLQEVGSFECEFDHNPGAVDLTQAASETITVSYPLLSGQTTPARLTFLGFVTKQGGEEMKVDDRMTTKVSIRVTGPKTYIAPT
jgi:hypothetical protein